MINFLCLRAPYFKGVSETLQLITLFLFPKTVCKGRDKVQKLKEITSFLFLKNFWPAPLPRKQPKRRDYSALYLVSTGILPARCSARLVDRKSTRLNSSHVRISYAVFCLKKK